MQARTFVAHVSGVRCVCVCVRNALVRREQYRLLKCERVHGIALHAVQMAGGVEGAIKVRAKGVLTDAMQIEWSPAAYCHAPGV